MGRLVGIERMGNTIAAIGGNGACLLCLLEGAKQMKQLCCRIAAGLVQTGPSRALARGP